MINDPSLIFLLIKIKEILCSFFFFRKKRITNPINLMERIEKPSKKDIKIVFFGRALGKATKYFKTLQGKNKTVLCIYEKTVTRIQNARTP